MGDFSFITATTINAGITYLGVWDASTNTPTLTSGVGNPGDYYIVSVAGTTNLDGITNWQVSDWAIFSTANTWQKIDNATVQSYSLIQNQGSNLTQQSIIDFQGPGVVASNGVGKTIVTVGTQQAYNTIEDEGTPLTQQSVLNFLGAGVTASNGVGKTNVTIDSLVNGTTSRVAMFIPNATTVGDSPISIGPLATRVFGTNTGNNSVDIGYGNALSGIDNFLVGYDLLDGGGQEVYALGNRLTINPGGTVYGVTAVGFFNNISNNASGLYLMGDSNSFVTDTAFCLIVGESNAFDNVSQLSVLGNNSTYTNIYDSRFVGSYNGFTDSNSINILGDGNTISLSDHIINAGTGNQISGSSYVTIIGINNVISSVTNRTIIGSGGLGIQINDANGYVGLGLAIGASISERLTVNGNVSVSNNIILPNTTTSSLGVITKGGNRFLHNFKHPTGSTAIPIGRNVMLGELAGNFTMGSTATATTQSSNNVLIGFNSGANITIGYSNVCVGSSTGANITTGYQNTFVGFTAGTNNTTGYFNTFVGDRAGLTNSVGFNNSYFGTLAGTSATGSNNSFFGYYTGALTTTGASNSAFGSGAGGTNTTGSSNTFFGSSAGAYLADGVTSNQTGANSVFFGVNTKALSAGNTNQIVVGYNAIGNGSNTVTIGDANITDNYIRGNFNITNGRNIILGTATGTKIGTATNQLLSFWNATPIVQPTTTTTPATFAAGVGGTAVTTNSTYDGYTLAKVVKALRNLGLLQ